MTADPSRPIPREEIAAQSRPCLYTVETGKHEWNTLHSVHQANAPVWFKRCPECGWIDLDDLRDQFATLQSDALQSILRVAALHNGPFANQVWRLANEALYPEG